MRQLNTKADNIQAIQDGYFGNAPRQWQTIGEVFKRTNFSGSIVIRSRKIGGKCWYGIDLLDWYCSDIELDPRDYYFNEMIDPKTVLINGEITRGPIGRRG